jgi:hypothetical protein
LEAIYHAEGRCTPNGATAFYYEYTLKDHLGNARVNFRANGTAVTFLEEMHYYPFGMEMEGAWTAQVQRQRTQRRLRAEPLGLRRALVRRGSGQVVEHGPDGGEIPIMERL